MRGLFFSALASPAKKLFGVWSMDSLIPVLRISGQKVYQHSDRTLPLARLHQINVDPTHLDMTGPPQTQTEGYHFMVLIVTKFQTPTYTLSSFTERKITVFNG